MNFRPLVLNRTFGALAIAVLLQPWSVFSAPATEGTRDHVRLALLRAVPTKWDLEKNFAVIRAAVPAAAKGGAEIFITPECWLDGYASPDPASTPERILEIAQPLETSPYLREVAALAREHRLWICFAFTSRENGRAYDAAGLWNDRGERVGIYHKVHLLDHDLQYAPGMDLPAFGSPWGPLGIVICADRRWPETVRVVRLHGTRLILNPSYGSHSELNEAMMRTRAFENGCYIAFAHPEEGLVTGPDGEIVAKAESETEGGQDAGWKLLFVNLDLTRVDDHGHLEYRRPDLYGPLVERRTEPAESAGQKRKP